jgi:hypothetical protein
MASLRRKYQGVESKDAPPVTTVPNETAAQLPEPVVDAKPLEQPAAELSPAEQAAQSALKQRLQEMQHAEALTRQAINQQPQYAPEPQEPQMPTAEQIIASSGLPENAKDWLRAHPDYVLDPVKNAKLQKMHNVAEYQAGSEFTAPYFDRMEVLLGFKQEPTNGQAQHRPIENGPPPPAPTTPRNVAPPRQTMSVSAPPSRESPSMVTGRPRSMRVPLTADELLIAQQCGQTPEQYQEQKEKMRRMKESGAIQ